MNHDLYFTPLVLLLLSTAVVGCGQASQAPPVTPTSVAPTRATVGPESSPLVVLTAETSAESPITVEQEPPSPSPSEGAANADVMHVRAVQSSDGTWTFHVTVRHPDIDWEDYADGWDVVAPDGTVLKPNPESQFTRTLLHPHQNEQPFTRSQSGIVIPDGVTQVRVRAHDLVDGFGGREVIVDLTARSGPDFEVERFH
jgi:hypothetical protein